MCTIEIMNDEVVVTLESRKNTYFYLGIALLSFSILIAFLVFIPSWLNVRFISPLVIFILTLFLSSAVIKGLLWKIFGRRVLTISSRYVIMQEIVGRNSVFKVTRIDAIAQINLRTIEDNVWWVRFKSFWSRDYDETVQYSSMNGLYQITISMDDPDADSLMLALKNAGLQDKIQIQSNSLL